MDNMKKKLITIGIIFIFFTVIFSGCNETTQNSDENVNEDINTENSDLFYCKKVIIRDDDIGSGLYLPSVKWIAGLAVSNDFKVTLSVIPTTLVNSLETINYLNQLDQDTFEFATHGYEHIKFGGLPYDEQYTFIKNGTEVLEEHLQYKPFTFVPPYGASDTNTTKVLSDLGYHSITDMRASPCYVEDFVSDFAYETAWDPVKHCSFEEFKSSFDTFYSSSDEYYIIFLHDWTFLNEDKNLNETKTDVFEEVINYIKSKNAQFMTIEEAYRRQTDENIIETGLINENNYFIDLGECTYNHTIKISPPSSWEGDIYLIDEATGQETILDKEKIEFKGTKGHYFNIRHIL